SIGNGNWTDPGAWDCGHVPINGDEVIIEGSHTILIPNTNVSSNGSITVKGTITFTGQLTLGSSSGCGYTLTITNTGKLQEGGPGNNERLIICGQTVLSTNPTACPGSKCFPNSPGYVGGGGTIIIDEDGPLPVNIVYFKSTEEDNRIIL